MASRISELVETIVRPLVEADGGTVELVEESAGRVVLRLGGACAGCPGLPYTRGHVIQPLLTPHLGRGVELVVDAVATA
jgi:Fe-S cluster biogenesis protein NfuA